MAGNPLIQAANNWFNNTIRNGGQKEAPGSASNNTIAAAATTQQTSATTQQTSASQNKRPTPGKGNYGKKDDDRRSQSAGASALQESINSGKSTSTKSTGNTTTQPTVKPNISGVVTETQTGTTTQPTVKPNISGVITETQIGAIQPEIPYFEVTGAGNKLGNAILKNLIVEPVNDLGTTIETIFVQPDGKPNLRNNIFQQIDAYNEFDNSGSQRQEAAISTITTVPVLFFGGSAIGASTRIGQAALSRAAATNFGAPIVYKLTTPISKTVKITPSTIAVNTVPAGLLAADINYVASQPAIDEKINAIADIATFSIIGSAGAVKGYKVADNVANKLKTLGKTEIPAERVTVPGIPLGNFNEAQLAESFNKNILSPQPNKFARATSEIGKDTAATVSAKLNPSDNVIELYHATASGSNFGKKFTVKESESEFGGLFTAPKGISYFLGDSVNEVKVSPAIFIRDFRPVESPALLNIKSRGVKPVDWQKAADSVGRSVRQVKNNPELRKTAVDNFLISAESKNSGYAYMPMIKREYEAVIPQGTQLKRTRSRYYTRINNTRVPIYEYEPVGFTAGRKTATRPRRLSSSSSAELRSSSKNYVPAISPISPYSGSTRSTRSSSEGGMSSIRDSFTAQLSEISRDSPQKTTKTAYTATQTNYNSPVKTTTRGNTLYSNIPTTRGNSLYSNITANKATPQKITPIDTNYLSRKSNQLIKRQKKPSDERKETEKLYSAVRTGRIDHLSIKDPLEFYGTGKSITNRNRPDRVLNKQALYFVDNAITTRRPTGRRKVKP